MSAREEVNEAITAFAIAVKESMAAHYLIDSDEQDLIKARQNKQAARARLLALLAPEPEPSEREIEAAAKAMHERRNPRNPQQPWKWWEDGPEQYRDACRADAKAVLVAAAARAQADGETAE